MEYYSAIKKNEILPFGAKWMELEDIVLSEIKQIEKTRYLMLSLHVEANKKVAWK
jgi:hypothetical protein